jgi:hypothetical protein
MNKLLMTTALAAAIGASPAHARLQLSISDGASTFSCFDGQLSCDVSGGANNLLTIDQTIGGFFVQLTLTQSTFGKVNELQLSSSSIANNGAAEGTLTFVASDTNFVQPVVSVRDSASLTFNSNVGAGDSTLKFWADPADVQGANPNNTPGALLETVSGAAATDPDSFSGSNDVAFLANAPFSMTEGAALDLIAWRQHHRIQPGDANERSPGALDLDDAGYRLWPAWIGRPEKAAEVCGTGIGSGVQRESSRAPSASSCWRCRWRRGTLPKSIRYSRSTLQG